MFSVAGSTDTNNPLILVSIKYNSSWLDSWDDCLNGYKCDGKLCPQ